MSKTAADLRKERAKLNAAIRAAERAEKKAAEQAVADAKHSLGQWLANALGATTVDEVEALREAVDLDHVRERVTAPAVTGADDTADVSDDEGVVDSSAAQERDEQGYVGPGVGHAGY